MPKLFQFAVKLKCNPSGFFVPLTPYAPLGVYLCKIQSDPAGCKPGFSDVPSCFPLSSALVLARELRRAGYAASVFPFSVLMAVQVLVAFVRRRKARRADKAVWK